MCSVNLFVKTYMTRFVHPVCGNIFESATFVNIGFYFRVWAYYYKIIDMKIIKCYTYTSNIAFFVYLHIGPLKEITNSIIWVH